MPDRAVIDKKLGTERALQVDAFPAVALEL